ncbi:excalibur calcium-binding domain-containing protein [Streptomyces sp. NRRL B-24484]|uniref:excalibur calcium-binding domain-containing protein n=1 Tax=Streptomyces sp. NRRL B-24484 TaxID=1463833 RepID=UPI0005B895B1|nr:excalibur calcium-binding domain-containing protein [Streptomyces sp. NRRL B-24484]
MGGTAVLLIGTAIGLAGKESGSASPAVPSSSPVTATVTTTPSALPATAVATVTATVTVTGAPAAAGQSEPSDGGAQASTPVPESNGPAVYYKNCSEARAAGVAPLHRGDPGYAPHLDRDGDGVACETG